MSVSLAAVTIFDFSLFFFFFFLFGAHGMVNAMVGLEDLKMSRDSELVAIYLRQKSTIG